MKPETTMQNQSAARQSAQFQRRILPAMIAACFACDVAWANPQGPEVVNGQVGFSAQGNILSISNSPNSIINWQGFSINAGEITRFVQQNANSAVLNRIVGQNPSQILGALQSNGRVFLINPNGIVFGRGAQVDVNGLVASSLNISNTDFLSGKQNFQAGAQAGDVRNQGAINTPGGGQVFLLAPNVENSGIITSPSGEVILAAGRSIQLVDSSNPAVQVTLAAPGNQAINLGQIIAHGGKIGIYGALVNQRGMLNADSAVLGENGKILLKASRDTALEANSLTTATGAGKGGDITLLGERVGLMDNAKVDASGQLGGGTVLVGGDYQGKNAALQNAKQTYFGPDAEIKANALQTGDGGKVILWADDTTQAYGNIFARGGALGGNGGFAEASGERYLDFRGRADLSAPKGKTGSLLLDPASNISINSSGGDISPTGSGPYTFDGTSSGSIVNNSTLQTQLGSADVSVLGGADITVDGNIIWGSTTKLTLHAGTNIVVNQSIGGGAASDLILLSDSGNISQTASIQAGKLSATATAGSVALTNVNNSVGTLAGAAGTTFAFTNDTSQNLVVGTAGVASGGAASISVGAGKSLAVNGPINAAGVTLNADKMSFAGSGAVNAGSGPVVLAPVTALTNIELGLGATNGLALTDTALGTVSTTGTLTIGGSNAGDTNVVGALNLSAKGYDTLLLDSNAGIIAVNGVLAAPATLVLNTTGPITQGGGKTIAATALKAVGATVTLTEANPVGVIAGAATAGNFAYKSAAQLTLSDADGITVPNGSMISLESPIGINQTSGAINAAGGGSNSAALKLTSIGSVDLTNASNAIGNIAADLKVSGTGSGTLSVVSKNNMTVTQVEPSTGITGITTNNANISLATAADKSLTLTNKVDAGSADVVLTTDGFNPSGTGPVVVAGVAAIRQATSGREITIGSTACVTAPCLLVYDLFKVQAPKIVIGSKTTSGLISVVGIGGSGTGLTNTNAATDTIILATAGGVSQAGAITMPNLAIDAGAAVALGSTNMVTSLAGKTSSQTFTFDNGQAFEVKSLSGGTAPYAYTVGGVGTAGGNIQLTSSVGDVTLSAPVNAGAGAVTLNSAAGIIQNSDTITGASLSALAVGGIGVNPGMPLSTTTGTLTATSTTGAINISNTGGLQVTNLSAANDVVLTNAGALTIGGAASSTSGNLAFSASSNLTLGAGSSVSAGGAGVDTLILATAAAFVNNSGGTTPLSASGSGARWLVYSPDPANNTLNSMGMGFKRYSCNLANVCSTAGTTVPASGNGFVYGIAPQLAVAPGGSSNTYGITPSLSTAATLSGFINGDTAATPDAVAGTASFSSAVTSSTNAGSYNVAYASGLSSALGYTFVDNYRYTGEHSVSPAALNLKANDFNKTFDSIAFSGGNGVTATGFVNGDGAINLGGTLTFTGSSQGAVNAGAYVITPGGYTSGNYNITFSDGVLTIGKALVQALTANITGNPTKAYDGTVNAVLKPTDYTLVGLQGGDAVSVNKTGGSYDSANAGARTVLVSFVDTDFSALGSTLLSNYSMPTSASGAGTIDKAALTVKALDDSKTYDGKAYAGGKGVTYAGLVNGEAATVLGGTLTYGGSAQGAINAGGYVITPGGLTSNNYTLAFVDGALTIARVNVTVIAASVTGNPSKVYDGNTLATLTSANYSLSGFVGSDSASVGKTSGVYDSAKAGSRTVTVSLTDTDFAAGSGTVLTNYALPSSASGSGSITPAALTVSGVRALDRIYDGTTVATLSSGTLNGTFGADAVGLSAGTGSFADKNIGNAKPVTLVSLSLTGADAANYTLTLPSGLSATIDPATLTFTGMSAASRAYNGGTAADVSGGSLNGVFGADSVGYTFATGSFADKNVGNAKPVAVSGLRLAGKDAGNYSLTLPSGLTANVTPASLTLSGLGAQNRAYDTTSIAQVNGGSLSGVFGTDSVGFTAASGAFADKNVGNAKPVTVSGVSLNGQDAGNYALTAPSGLTANITPASLTISGMSAASRAYDASTAAQLAGGSLGGVLGTDSVGFAGGSGAFADKNVGNAKPVTVSGLNLSGQDAGNYAVAAPSGLTANITLASLTISGMSAVSRAYDTTSVAELGGGSLSGVLGSESVGFGGASGAFADKNVGNAKPVSVSGASLSGPDAANYALTAPSGLTANITAANLTISGMSAVSRAYDTTSVTQLAGGSLGGVLGADKVGFSGAVGGFADKNVGTAKPVTVSGLSLSGQDAANYAVAAPAGLSANITAANLTIAGMSAQSKTYDAKTTAPMNNGSLAGVLGTDTVSIQTASAGFADKGVGKAKTVTLTGVTLGGADAGNYKVTLPTGFSADINQAGLTISGMSAASRVYDTTSAATVSGGSLQGVLGADQVGFNAGSASFADKNVGNAKAVTVADLKLSGLDAANYVLSSPSGLSANITPAALAVAGLTASSRTYNATTVASLSQGSLSGVLGTDKVGMTTPSGGFADKNVGKGKAVAVSGLSLSGLDAGNYSLTAPSGLVADITPAAITVSGLSAVSRDYNGNTGVNLLGGTLAGKLGSDVVDLSAGTGSFADKNVGTAKPVSIAGLSLSGQDAANYALSAPANLSANITPAKLTVTGMTAVSRTYDAGTKATLKDGSLRGVIGSDVVALAASSGSFADKNVGVAKAVSVASLALSGGDAANYTVTPPTGLSADISAAKLTVGVLSASDKAYDGATLAKVTGGALAGVLGTDAVTLDAPSASFANKNAGKAKAVTLATLALNGVDAGNYTVSTPSGLTATITPATLQIADLSAVSRPYDGSTAATLQGGVVSGVIGTDKVSLATIGAVFADKNAGLAKPLVFGAIGISGLDAGNYSVAAPSGLSANITPLALTLTGMSAQNRPYDGTTAATLANGSLSGVLGTDKVTVGGGTASFADKNVGNAKAVTVSGVTLGGTDSANYTVAAPSGLAANITPASLSLSGLKVADKVYDGNTKASLSGGTLIGVIGKDDVLAVGSGSFADKNVGGNKAVSIGVGDVKLSGADAGNYTVSDTVNKPGALSGNITVRPLATWIGVGSGSWNSAANWQDGVVPEGANVAAVSLPGASAVEVQYDGALGATTLKSLTGSQNLTIGAGNLTLAEASALNGGAVLSLAGSANLSTASSLSVAKYAQSGGSLSGAGSLTVTEGFAQTGGTIDLSGAAGVSITQAENNLQVGKISAAKVALNAQTGAIAQSGAMVTKSLSAQSAKGSDFTNSGNQIGSFSAVNTDASEIKLLNTSAPLKLAGISNGGPVTIDNTGAITLSAPLKAPKGKVKLTAHSPINIDAAVEGQSIELTASTDIVLGSTGSLSVAADGNITALAEGGNFTANPGSRIGVGAVRLSAPNGVVSAPASVFTSGTPAPSISDKCFGNPSAAGCGAVLPTLSSCIANPAAARCSLILPSLAQCTAAPTLPGCSAVLPPVSDCTRNPAAPGCSVVLPPTQTASTEPIGSAINSTVNLINTSVSSGPAAAPSMLASLSPKPAGSPSNSANSQPAPAAQQPAASPPAGDQPANGKPGDKPAEAKKDDPKKDEAKKDEAKKDDKADDTKTAVKDTEGKKDEPVRKLYCN